MVGQFFGSDGKLQCWDFLQGKYLLSQKIKFKWLQLTHAFPREWKEAISVHDGSLKSCFFREHYLIKKNQILCLTKLNSNQLNKIQVIIKYQKPTS